MKNKMFIKVSTKYTIAVCALLAAPVFYAQKSDTATRSKNIEEVVLIGYGTAKKGDLTGSVSSIKGSELTKVPISNVAETLTGKIAGVRISTAEGSPDSDVSIRIRGGGSITQDSGPLVIVDGFPVNNLSDIAPSDIENISILKDASSTAIYGSRGSNGVILVTTKSGKSGKLNVSYNTFSGFKKIAKTFDVLGVEDYVNWQYEFATLKNDLKSYTDIFGTYAEKSKYNGMQGEDWQREIYGRTGTVLSNDIGIRGGNEKANFSINLARYDEKGILLGSDLVRDNISFNFKSKPNDKIDLAATVRYANTVIGGSGTNEQNEISSADSRLKNTVLYAPFNLPGITAANVDDADDGYLTNPFTNIIDNDRAQQRRNYNIQGSVGWKIVKNLQFRSDVGIDYTRYKDSRFYGRSTYFVRNIPPTENQNLPALIMGIREDQGFRNSNTLNYDFKQLLGDNHQLKLLLGEEIIIKKQNILTNTIHGYPKLFTFENTVNLSSQGKPFSVNNYTYPDDRLLSFFGRVNYDFKNRYLFTATMRADGSSKFLGDNKWGFFPSAAVAWKMNEENFLKNISWIDLLKLRVSYGEAGNNNIPVGQTVQLFESSNSSWINNVENYWAPSKILANPELKWETAVTQNIGLDFDFFKGRISGSVEAYKNLSKDLLIRFPVPGSGYDYQFRNMGEVENRGIEGSVSVDIVKKEDFNFNFGFNIGVNKNEVNSLGLLNDFGQSSGWASTAIGDDFLVQVGQPIGGMYGYLNDGRYEVSDFNYNAGVYTLKDGVTNSSTIIGDIKPGSMKLKDINGDGKVTIDDRTIIGNANPDFSGGFAFNSTFKNFDFSAAFTYSYGNEVYNANKIEYTTSTASSPDGQYRNLSSEMAGGIRWNNIDPNTGLQVTDPTALAALNANTTLWSPYMQRFVLSDWAVEDGSFLRLNNVTLGYSLPKDLTSKIGLSKIRVYATANNVFVLTKYSGLDPEVSTRRNTPLTPGVDYSPYPKSRLYVLGLNVNF